MKVVLNRNRIWRAIFLRRWPGNPLWYWLYEAYLWNPNTCRVLRDPSRWSLVSLTRLVATRAVLVFLACTLFGGMGLGQDQPAKTKKIGILWSGTADGTAPYWGAFAKGLRELGWEDGKTAKIILRFDNDDKSRLPKLATELVAMGVDVLAVTTIATEAAKKATTTIPIVNTDSGDPIAEGFTSNLRKPRGNVTGVSWQSLEIASKHVELMRELIPDLKRSAVLYDANDSLALMQLKGWRAAVNGTDVELRGFEVRTAADYPAAFAAIKAYRPQVLLLPTLVLTAANLDQTVRFATTLRIPMVSEASEFAEAGVLLTYGADYRDAFKRAAILTDKILKGAKPADLPWEQPTKFELAVNMKTAKALGMKIPETIMVRATKVIR